MSQGGRALTQVRSKARAGSMAESIARRIAEFTKDGDELVMFAWRTFQDPTMPFEDRKWAFEWLAKYGAGLPQASLSVSGTITHGHVRVNLEHFTNEELEAYERMRLAAQERARLAQAKDATVIDVESKP